MNRPVPFQWLPGLLVACLMLSGMAQAATGEQDAESLQRGATVYLYQCRLCHDMKYLQYQDLLQLGFNRRQLAGLSQVRSLRDKLQSTMGPEPARILFGMQPPDLSLMARAREGGADYIVQLLTGYHSRADGSIDNRVFPQIRMPDVLAYSIASDSQARLQLEVKARDVAAFLEWAADPSAVERRQLGYYVMAYLVVLTILLYLVKKKVWRRLQVTD